MNQNTNRIIKKLSWVFYTLAFVSLVYFLLPFFNLTTENEATNTFFNRFETGIIILVFVIVGFGVIALIQQFFYQEFKQDQKTHDSSKDKILLKINMPNQLAGSIILFFAVIGFSSFMNIILFFPDIIFEEEIIEGFLIFEKILFGFFYLICHFLVIVFGLRLFRGMPPIFIATEKGFCYEPAGISTGWILWEDVLEVRESSVLKGGPYYGPKTESVLGIKLRNPEEYNLKTFSPMMKYLVESAQKLNDYQTEGVGDMLLNPVDFGIHYGKVREILLEYSKRNKK